MAHEAGVMVHVCSGHFWHLLQMLLTHAIIGRHWFRLGRLYDFLWLAAAYPQRRDPGRNGFDRPRSRHLDAARSGLSDIESSEAVLRLRVDIYHRAHCHQGLYPATVSANVA